MNKLLLCTALLLMAASASAAEPKPLYGPKGISEDAVRQGSVGSCYFHAVIGALAAKDPDLLRSSISENGPGDYTVHFADGATERVTAVEAVAAIDNGYDDSDGLWVSVLYRAFAHRIMRRSLLGAVNGSQMIALAKYGAVMLINSSDAVLNAYDGAVRSQIAPDGSIDKAALRARLEEELRTTPLSAETRDRVLDVIDTQGFFEPLAADVKANGEIFGAYRSTSQSGLPHRVFEAFYGSVRDLGIAGERDLFTTLQTAARDRVPMVASTRASAPLASIPGTSMWYVNSHAYTVLGFDSEKKNVTLRNPWGEHPAPDGRFTIPLDTFRAAYETMCIAEPDKKQ